MSSKQPVSSLKEAARRRREAQAPLSSVPGFERVLPFPEWCRLKGISLTSGKRLVRAGKVRVTHLSANRIGISESADRDYMKACESA